MMDVVTLPAAVAIGGLGMTLFALTRRLMRANQPPRWLASDVTAYVVALLFTGYIALSLMGTATALAPFVGSIAKAGIASIALHIALWMVARVIIPIGAPGHGELPPTIKAA